MQTQPKQPKQPVTIFHASDLHYCAKNLIEADRCFSHAVTQAIKADVDAAIISGDTTDHRLEAHSPAFFALIKQIQRLANHCPVFMLQGTFSHEPVGFLQVMSMISAKHPIRISDRVEMIALEQGEWVDFIPSDLSNYSLVLTSVPTLNKAELVLTMGAGAGADTDATALGHSLAVLFESFASINALARNAGIPTVLVSHGTVDGSLNETGAPMAGPDNEFSLGALYGANASATCLGHVHKHQFWERIWQGTRQIVAYPGSIGRFHYGEIGDKMALLWTVSAADAAFVQIVTPAKVQIDIAVTGLPDMHELALMAANCAGVSVRLRITLDGEHAAGVDRSQIENIFTAAQQIKIEVIALPVQRQRCPGISMLSTTAQKLQQWAENAQVAAVPLNDRLALLQNTPPEAIVAAIMARHQSSGVQQALPC